MCVCVCVCVCVCARALLVVGDFNARVGSNLLDLNNVEWNGVRGIHGVGNINKAGRALLPFVR